MSSIERTTIILGAGLAGLSAAYHLNSDYRIFEASGIVGGVAGSFRSRGFIFDHAIHVLFTKDPYASALLRSLLKDNFLEQERSSWVYSAGVYTPYPYQAHMYGLPDDIVEDNIRGLADALERPRSEPRNFEEWILQTFGEGIALNFMLPFNRKVWACEPSDMSFDWISDRVIEPTLSEVLRGARAPFTKSYGPNAQFWYPRYGGTMALPLAMLQHVRPPELGTACLRIDERRSRATFSDGHVRSYDSLISTIPLPQLVSQLSYAPESVQQAAKALRSNTVHTVNIGVAREGISDKHWVYVADEKIPFHRISFPANFSSSLAPEGTSSIMLEISESDFRPVDRTTIVARSIAALEQIGILREDDRILTSQTYTIDPAYIIYDDHHHEARDTIMKYLQHHDIHSCGRFGEWEYFNMDHTILSGKRAAERVMEHANKSFNTNLNSIHV